MQQTQLLSQPHRLPACVLVTAKRPIWRVSSTSSKRLQRVPYISSSINHSGLTPGRSKVTAGAAASASLWDHGRQRTKLFDTAFDKEIAQVALPALVSMLLEPVMGVINSGMVGRLGTQQLGAVSVASLCISFATFLFSFLLFLTTPEIAAAVVRNDKAEVSRISVKGFWVAGVAGLVVTAALVLCGPAIIKLMNPPEPAVAKYATEYIGIRAWGLLAALLGFVATGTYRGFKDTRTPLFAAACSAAVSLALNYTFICVLGWGVWGSGLAITVAQAFSTTILCSQLIAKGMVRVKDLMVPPTFKSVVPLLRRGVVLALRNTISFGMILYASLLCVRAGSMYQASFEVIRQVWILTIQCFECLNVAAQTLCSSYLGSGDSASADALLQRLLFLGVGVGASVGLVVFLAQHQIVGWFTRDANVVNQVLTTLPMVAALFPLDAIASILDGSLLAAKHTDYMSVVQIGGSMLQYGALVYLASNGLVSALSIWATLKVLTLVRVGGGVYRNYMSPASAYLPKGKRSKHATAGPRSSFDQQQQQRSPAASPTLPVAAAATAELARAGAEQGLHRSSSERTSNGSHGSTTSSSSHSSNGAHYSLSSADQRQQGSQASSNGEASGQEEEDHSSHRHHHNHQQHPEHLLADVLHNEPEAWTAAACASWEWPDDEEEEQGEGQGSGAGRRARARAARMRAAAESGGESSGEEEVPVEELTSSSLTGAVQGEAQSQQVANGSSSNGRSNGNGNGNGHYKHGNGNGKSSSTVTEQEGHVVTNPTVVRSQ